MGLIVIHAQVRLAAEDDTVFLVGNLHITSGTDCDANGLERRKVPGSGEQAERFKQQAMRNTLDQMIEGAAQARDRLPSALPHRRETWSWCWSATSI